MKKWTYCETSIPVYLDLVKLARVINYNKRRMMSVMVEPKGNGYSDLFAAQVAINNYVDRIEALNYEYKYMVTTYINGERSV